MKHKKHKGAIIMVLASITLIGCSSVGAAHEKEGYMRKTYDAPFCDAYVPATYDAKLDTKTTISSITSNNVILNYFCKESSEGYDATESPLISFCSYYSVINDNVLDSLETRAMYLAGNTTFLQTCFPESLWNYDVHQGNPSFKY